MLGLALFIFGAYMLLALSSWGLGFRVDGPVVLVYKQKTGPVWAILALLYKLISFGGDFYAYNTTIGKTCYLARGLSELPPAKVAHELNHVLWCQRLGFGHVWLGLPALAFLYIFGPLPVVLSYFRYRFELAGYLAEGAPDEYIIDQLGGPAYFFAWPKFLIRRALASRPR